MHAQATTNVSQAVMHDTQTMEGTSFAMGAITNQIYWDISGELVPFSPTAMVEAMLECARLRNGKKTQWTANVPNATCNLDEQDRICQQLPVDMVTLYRTSLEALAREHSWAQNALANAKDTTDDEIFQIARGSDIQPCPVCNRKCST
jgi:hypothetical protein